MATCVPQQENMTLQERFGELDIFKQPECLVYSNDERQLQINESVLGQIGRIDVPVSVVGVCGVYRSGKSYLMNKLMGNTKGFSVGNSTRSQTKGIWVWCKFHPTVTNQVLIFLDTEGLSSAVKGDQQHDTKIFCLTMLMSSVLIYNLKGVIEEDSLKKLSFMTEVTKVISMSGSTNDEQEKADLKYVSPHFVLCLRDFFYDLYDDANKNMSPNQYMEDCFLESPDQQQDDEFNSIRRCIKTFFPTRTCFTLAQPALNQKLKVLDTMPEEELAEEFRNDIQKLITFVHSSGTKEINRITRNSWNGETFELFMRNCIDKLVKGQKLEYCSTMQAVSMTHNEKLEDAVCEKYQAQLDKLALPESSKKELSDKLKELRIALLREFREGSYPYSVEYYEDRCMEKMTRMMDDVLKNNSRLVHETCYKYLSEERKQMIEKNKAKYDTNLDEYKKDFDAIVQQYHKKFESYDELERFSAVKAVISESKDEVLEMEYKSKMHECEIKMEESQKKEQEESNRYKDEFKKEQNRIMDERLSSYQQRITELEIERSSEMASTKLKKGNECSSDSEAARYKALKLLATLAVIGGVAGAVQMKNVGSSLPEIPDIVVRRLI